MRIVFPLIGGPQWLGGRNWLRNLLDVLAEEAPGAVTALLLVEEETDPADVAPFRLIDGVELHPVSRGEDPRLRALSALLRPDPQLVQTCQALQADLLFEANGFAGLRFPIPILSWIPDFQHRHLPDYFPASMRLQRHLQMLARIRSPRHFMLSSRDAEADCHHFYPATSGRTSVVSFAVRPGPDPGPDAFHDAIARHAIPEHFVFLPNQFWAHKNHACIIEALTYPESGGCVVVATGAESDPRRPDHARQLHQRVAELGLGERFRTLGMVPYRDVGILMRGAQALVNPSRFEGWSTTVEEAKSLGVPLLLSDIGVHREQAGETASYFGPDDSRGAAVALGRVMVADPAERTRRATDAARNAKLATARFAERFLDCCEKAIRAAGRQPVRP